jgi:hypothetical protein
MTVQNIGGCCCADVEPPGECDTYWLAVRVDCNTRGDASGTDCVTTPPGGPLWEPGGTLHVTGPGGFDETYSHPTHPSTGTTGFFVPGPGTYTITYSHPDYYEVSGTATIGVDDCIASAKLCTKRKRYVLTVIADWLCLACPGDSYTIAASDTTGNADSAVVVYPQTSAAFEFDTPPLGTAEVTITATITPPPLFAAPAPVVQTTTPGCTPTVPSMNVPMALDDTLDFVCCGSPFPTELHLSDERGSATLIWQNLPPEIVAFWGPNRPPCVWGGSHTFSHGSTERIQCSPYASQEGWNPETADRDITVWYTVNRVPAGQPNAGRWNVTRWLWWTGNTGSYCGWGPGLPARCWLLPWGTPLGGLVNRGHLLPGSTVFCGETSPLDALAVFDSAICNDPLGNATVTS